LVATVTEAKNRLSALIDRVKGGESVLIVDRGTPVARLESVIGASPDPEGRIARLERAGAVRAARAEPPTTILSSPPPRLSPGTSGVTALLEERRGGR
jgi:prevent-host-death family protein